jgi:microsomal dipeptidase-like Zn-dependent dipeptidase
MSARTRNDVLGLAETCGYPGLVASHAGFTALHKGDKKHEGQLTPKEVQRLLGLGGLVAPILNQGTREQLPSYARASGTRVTSDCGSSAKSFAQAYLYAVDQMNGGAVGFGSDLNGLAGMPTPRFGPFACGGDKGAEQHNRVRYPVALYPGMGDPMPESQAGHRVFDINVDGFAHAGMFPDFVAELRAVGLTQHDLEPLFSSAEAYIALWERATQSQLSCGAN